MRAYWLDWKDRANCIGTVPFIQLIMRMLSLICSSISYTEEYIRSEECAKCYANLRESRKRLYRCQRGFQMNLEQFCKVTERYIKVGDRAEVLKLQCKKVGGAVVKT